MATYTIKPKKLERGEFEIFAKHGAIEFSSFSLKDVPSTRIPSVRTDVLENLSRQQVWDLTPDQMKHFEQNQIETLASTGRVEWLSRKQLRALTPEQLSPKVLRALSSEQAQYLSLKQLGAIASDLEKSEAFQPNSKHMKHTAKAVLTLGAVERQWHERQMQRAVLRQAHTILQEVTAKDEQERRRLRGLEPKDLSAETLSELSYKQKDALTLKQLFRLSASSDEQAQALWAGRQKQDFFSQTAMSFGTAKLRRQEKAATKQAAKHNL